MVSIKVRRNCSINKRLLAPTTTKLSLQHGEPFDTGREQGRCVSAGLTANTSLWGHSLGFGAAPCPLQMLRGARGPGSGLQPLQLLHSAHLGREV